MMVDTKEIREYITSPEGYGPVDRPLVFNLCDELDTLRKENDRCKEIAERDGRDYTILTKQLKTAVEALEKLDTTYPISRDGIIQTALKEIKGEE